MIGIKGGTQTWSKAEQTPSFKSDNVQTLDAVETEKAKGGAENIGEVLNKIADPNYVDPAKTRRVGNPELGKDAFLKLLLAQMKNQDPTQPFDSHEMAAQLAQFSSLEKLQNIDDGLGHLAKANEPSNQFASLSLIGKMVSGDSTQIIRNDTKEKHDIPFELGADAKTVKISVRNSQGEVVRDIQSDDLKKGKNTINWNGVNNDGAPMGEGSYQVAIEATDEKGHKLGVETKFSGAVTGVNFTAEGPLLVVGQQKIHLKDVKGIAMPEAVTAAPQTPTAKITNDVKQKTDQVVRKVQSNLGTDVAMSQEMLNKLQRETQ